MRSLVIKSVALMLIMALAACQGRYAYLGQSMSQCGFNKAPYGEFHSCMDKSLPETKSGTGDYYTKTNNEIRKELKYCAGKVQAKEMKDAEAYAYFQQYVDGKVVEEQESAQIAGAVIAVGLVGVAGAACYNNGGCGGSSSPSNSLQGCCSWHDGVAGCVGGRVTCNDGQFSPTCRC